MKKIKIIKKEDELYPSKLLDITNPPNLLYVLGDEKLLNKKSLAIIGSRDCTEYGYTQAVRFAKEIAKQDICIVSGMAKGIDSAAHIGAKSELGKTIAVLGGGFHHIFPKENEGLFYEILQEGGCIISEYPPEVEAKGKFFPQRNRIVSGLSEGVLVVEARYRSGTSITAKFAKEQEKPIFCIPSNIDSITGYGTGVLIQEGAKLVLSPNDILQAFGIDGLEESTPKEKKEYIKVDKEYKEVYDVLSKVPISTNEICKRTNKAIGEVNVALTMLELQGAIKQVGVNEFIKS